MRKLLLLMAVILPIAVSAQQTTQSWSYDGQQRQYIRYVPPSYDGLSPLPVVFVFHGLGDNMGNMYGIGMNLVADTAKFIVIVPQALADPLAGTAWNSQAGINGLFFPNANVDDVGFVMAIIDTLSAQYEIDASRIYATGFSMGGFFTNRLACEHPDVFAAVASVSGTIGGGLNCQPSSPVRIAHFHGTADATVGYDENAFGMSVDEWFEHWQQINGCGNDVVEYALPDVANDNLTVDYKFAAECEEGSEVVHYRVNGAQHVWLGPNNDIFYTTEIWRFFLGVRPSAATGIVTNEPSPMGLWPNPTTDFVRIQLPSHFTQVKVTVTDITGRSTLEESMPVDGNIDLSSLGSGVYTLRAITSEGVFVGQVVKE